MYRYPTNLMFDLNEDVQRLGELGPQELLGLPESAPKTLNAQSANNTATNGAFVFDLSSLNGSNGFVIKGLDDDANGYSVSGAGDFNGDGYDDFLIGAFKADPNGIEVAGETYLIFGDASGFSPSLDLSTLDGTNGFVLNGIARFNETGRSVSSAGDLNGDGYDDILIGARGSRPDNVSYAGESYVVYGQASGFGASFELSSLDGGNGFVIKGIDTFHLSGTSVSSAGDVNGDGYDDILIGAPGVDSVQGFNIGESYLIFGKANGFSASLDLASLNGTNGFVLEGITPEDESGLAVSGAGDINGDGYDDILIGAYRGDPNGAASAGETYVVFGQASAFSSSLDLASLDGSNGFVINGINVADYSGRAVSDAGDVNGDGYDDILIGAYGADPDGESRSGESYVVFGKASGYSASFDLSSLDGSNGFALKGIDSDDFSGFAVSSAGDFNGDGYDDILIGAYGGKPNGEILTGESYLVFGKAGGFSASMDLVMLDGIDGFIINGIDRYDHSGFSVAGAGDINNDGFDDILIGAHSAVNNGVRTGESYVIFGYAAFDPSIDDYAGDSSTTGVLSTDETVVTGSIETDGDVDWFAVTVASGDILTVADPGGVITAQIVDAQGISLSNGTSLYGVPVSYLAPTSGTYYVSVESTINIPDENPELSDYELTARVTTPGPDDYAGDTTTTGVIPSDGTEVFGSLETIGDVDYFAFTVGANETWRFSLSEDEATPFTSALSVHSDTDEVLFSYGSTLDARLYYSFGDAGTYYVSVADWTGSGIGDYTLVAEQIVDDYGFTPDAAGSLTVGQAATGTIEWEDLAVNQQDYDLFEFDYTVGDAIRFYYSDVNFLGMSLIDEDYNYIDVNYATPGPNLELIASGLETGQYYILVEGSLGDNYTINSEYIADDFDEGSTTTGLVTLNRPATQTPETTTGDYDFDDDVDWFSFTAQTGEVIEFLSDENLTIVDAAGTVIAASSFANGINHTFAAAGEYFLTVFANVHDNNPVRDYSFTATSNTNLGPIFGTELGETLNGTAGNDTINALGGSDIVYGAAGNDTINGGYGNDFLRGDAGDDTLDGGFGVDWLRGGAGADVLNGWAGTDWADYITSSAAVTVNLLTNTATGGDAEGDTFLFIERVYGSSHDDHITGDNGVNYLRGWSGDDQLFGGAGNDFLQGGLGADTLDGGAGSDWAVYISSGPGLQVDLGFPASTNIGESVGDVYISIENVIGSNHDDTIFGDAGNNFLRGVSGDDVLVGEGGDDFLRGDLGADSLSGSAGNDWAYYAASNAAVTVNLEFGTGTGGHAEGDFLSSIERVFGSAFGDDITGDAGANYLRGYFGNDTLSGGAGNDFLQGDAGADVLNGGAGSDWAYYASSTATSGLTINLGDASQNTGEAAGDSYTSIENIVGSRFDDIITGDSGDNYLRGYLGDDTINGGLGNDILRGEAGADTFVFKLTGTGEVDRVIDYNDAEDMIDLSDFFGLFFDVNELLTNFASEINGDVIFELNGLNTVIIENTTITEIADNIII